MARPEGAPIGIARVGRMLTVTKRSRYHTVQHSLTALGVALVPAIGWGVMFFFLTQAVRDMDVLAAQLLFQLAGIPMLLLLIPLVPHAPVTLNLPLLLLDGALETFALTLYFYALRVGKLTIVGPIYQANVAITVALAVIVFHEHLYSLRILGIAVVVTGIALLGVQVSGRQRGALHRGVAPALLATLGTGVYLFLVSISSRLSGWFYTSLGIRVTIAFTILCWLVATRRRSISLFRDVPWRYLGAAAGLDVFAFSTFNWAVTRYDISYVAVMSAAWPVVSTVLAVVCLRERLTLRQVAGLLLVLVGVVGLNA